MGWEGWDPYILDGMVQRLAQRLLVVMVASHDDISPQRSGSCTFDLAKKDGK